MEIIIYALLIALILSFLLLIFCGYGLVKLDKQKTEDKIIHTEKDITFPTISKWEVNQVMRQIAKNEKKLMKMRKSYRRIIF